MRILTSSTIRMTMRWHGMGSRQRAQSRRTGMAFPTGMASSLLVIVWLLVVATGMAVLWRYEHTPATVTHSLETWPAKSCLTRSDDRYTLLFFAHPKCPCTRASIRELAQLMADCKGRIQCQAVFFKPETATDDWSDTDLWVSANEIPGVDSVNDIGGKEARLFQARTSGLCLLYDQQGNALFRGGITASRGHSGENMGRTAIVNIANGGAVEAEHTDVFGCAIHTPSDQGESE